MAIICVLVLAPEIGLDSGPDILLRPTPWASASAFAISTHNFQLATHNFACQGAHPSKIHLTYSIKITC